MHRQLLIKKTPTKLTALMCGLLLLLSHTTQAAPRFQAAENVDCKLQLNNMHSVRWYGPCINGIAEGVGTAQYLKNQKIEITYKGGMKNGEWHGQATVVDSNGFKHIGKYKNSYRHGQGTLLWPSNQGHKIKQYTGNFLNDLMHGQGTAIYFDGSKYSGKWVNDKPVGVTASTTNPPVKTAAPRTTNTLNSRKEIELTSDLFDVEGTLYLTDKSFAKGQLHLKMNIEDYWKDYDDDDTDRYVGCEIGGPDNNIFIGLDATTEEKDSVEFYFIAEKNDKRIKTEDLDTSISFDENVEATVLWDNGSAKMMIAGHKAYTFKFPINKARIVCRVSNGRGRATLNLRNSDVMLSDPRRP